MAINSINGPSTIRLMGMQSGMDTDSIIQQTLRLHQMRIDSRFRARTILEWRQQTHNSIRNEISAFRNSFLTSLGSTAMMNRNMYNATVATVTGKNAGAVSISTMVGSSVGSMTIGQIKQLASGAKMSSSGNVSLSGNGFSSSATLESLDFIGGKIGFTNYQASVVNTGGESVMLSKSAVDAAVWGDATSTFKLSNGTQVTLTRDDSGVDPVYTYTAKDANGAELYSGNVVFDGEGKALLQVGEDDSSQPVYTEIMQREDGKIEFEGKALEFIKKATVDGVELVQREDGQIQNNGRTLSFVGETNLVINDKEIKLTSNMTITQMLAKINSSGAEVTLSYDRLKDRFSIESTKIGGTLAEDLRLSSDGNFFDMLAGPGVDSSDGTLALVELNGIMEERNSNTFEYRGVMITLNQTTDAGDEETTVVFKRDATEAVGKIKDFITAYNAIIKRLEGLITERKTGRESSYMPLTDEEKSAMTDKQIEEWEAIAKKGILRNDAGIQNLVTSLRRSLFDAVEGAGMSPSDIGLSTGNFFGGTGGQIILDEDRLKAALENDPERVASIFVGSTDLDASYNEKGLIRRVNDLMGGYISTGGTQSRSLKSLEDSIKRANEQIDKMQQKLFAEEDKLYRQFAAMETALSKLQQQGDWFSSMLGNTQRK